MLPRLHRWCTWDQFGIICYLRILCNFQTPHKNTKSTFPKARTTSWWCADSGKLTNSAQNTQKFQYTRVSVHYTYFGYCCSDIQNLPFYWNMIIATGSDGGPWYWLPPRKLMLLVSTKLLAELFNNLVTGRTEISTVQRWRSLSESSQTKQVRCLVPDS